MFWNNSMTGHNVVCTNNIISLSNYRGYNKIWYDWALAEHFAFFKLRQKPYLSQLNPKRESDLFQSSSVINCHVIITQSQKSESSHNVFRTKMHNFLVIFRKLLLRSVVRFWHDISFWDTCMKCSKTAVCVSQKKSNN